MGDDFPVGIALNVRNWWETPLGLDLWDFWIAGPTVHDVTGEDYKTIHYQEFHP